MKIKLVGAHFNPVTLIKTIRCNENITLGKSINLKTAMSLANELSNSDEVEFEPTDAHMKNLSVIEIHDYVEDFNMYRVKVTN